MIWQNSRHYLKGFANDFSFWSTAWNCMKSVLICSHIMFASLAYSCFGIMRQIKTTVYSNWIGLNWSVFAGPNRSDGSHFGAHVLLECEKRERWDKNIKCKRILRINIFWSILNIKGYIKMWLLFVQLKILTFFPVNYCNFFYRVPRRDTWGVISGVTFLWAGNKSLKNLAITVI